MIAAALLAVRLVGVVDQIDGAWALVEWEGRALGFVPTHELPRGVREGDGVVLRPMRRGFLVELPREVAPDAGRHVVASLHPQRGPRRAPWRPR